MYCRGNLLYLFYFIFLFSIVFNEDNVLMAGWSKTGSVCPSKAYWDKRPTGLRSTWISVVIFKEEIHRKKMFHPFKIQLVWRRWHCMFCIGDCHRDLSLLLLLYDPETALQQDLIKDTPLLWLIREHQLRLCSEKEALIFREKERNAEQLVKQDSLSSPTSFPPVTNQMFLRSTC